MNYMPTKAERRWDGPKPPNYVAVYAWRQRRLMQIRERPSARGYALAYYADKPGEFINDWCDTVDPRRAGTNIPARVPFVLFKRQEELTQFLYELVKAQANGLIEKSRDMGATWDAVGFSCWAWRFLPGSSIGWGSRKAELVDRIGDMDSIFEKIRATIAGWPRQFLPAGFDSRIHSSYMKLINPENGSSITGESGDNIGRGGRKLFYFKDESAHYERPELIEAALGDNTNSQIDISSVNGPNNVFHRKREAATVWEPGVVMEKGRTYAFIMDWSDHPLKTQEWYDRRKEQADSEGLTHVFEQEVNRNYYGSVTGTIIPGNFVRACLDAHKIIPGMEDGHWRASIDPADEGADKHAAGASKNVVLKIADHWGEGDTGMATNRAIGMFKVLSGNIEVQYDSVGVGAGVKSESNRLAKLPLGDPDKLPKNLKFIAWNAGAAVLNPDDHIDKLDANSATNKEQYANRKAQAWWSLRVRCEKTMKAVAAVRDGKPCPYPVDELFSIDTEALGPTVTRQVIKELSQPVRKKDIVSTKLTIDKKPPGTVSPNIADMIVMHMFPVPSEGYDWSSFL